MREEEEDGCLPGIEAGVCIGVSGSFPAVSHIRQFVCLSGFFPPFPSGAMLSLEREEKAETEIQDVLLVYTSILCKLSCKQRPFVFLFSFLFRGKGEYHRSKQHRDRHRGAINSMT